MREASLGPSSMRTLRSSTAACFVHLSHSCTLPSSTLAPSSLSFSRARACLHRYTNTQEAQRARPPRGQTCPWDSSPLSPCNLQIRTRVQVHTCARGRWLRMLTCRLLQHTCVEISLCVWVAVAADASSRWPTIPRVGQPTLIAVMHPRLQALSRSAGWVRTRERKVERRRWTVALAPSCGGVALCAPL